MRLVFRYIRAYLGAVMLVMVLKLAGTVAELILPYILEHLIDEIVPRRDAAQIILWGLLMVVGAIACWQLNIRANRRAIVNAHHISYDIRQALFQKTVNLSGTQFDTIGLPSLTSRMTSDSYNVQSFAQTFQTLCVRAPIMLLGGVAVTLTMDRALSGLLCIMLPLLIAVILLVSWKGIPLYQAVQQQLDEVVRIMRENIIGIRVVKALSKEEYEKRRFHGQNDAMTKRDVYAGTVMALPGPIMQLCLNIGLSLVVLVGANRVNSGVMKPGVILAFLTYFNLIMQSVMALNRLFVMLSKAIASADRIEEVLLLPEDQTVLPIQEIVKEDAFIAFDHVSFRYGRSEETNDSSDGFQGGSREKCLYDISFQIKKGESLGIIGPTGCGKTTIINLLTRFYDTEEGQVRINGQDVRTYEKDVLHRKFGVAFQNDQIFQDSLRRNIQFGRNVDEKALRQAVEDAMAAEFIDGLPDGLEHRADIKGANLSGGQKQRLLISRALAGDPELLILDDSSSALDYKTDAAVRKAIAKHHKETTTILIAQRVSSVMGMTQILVLDNGHCIGYGTHEELLQNCPFYRETYEYQMGDVG